MGCDKYILDKVDDRATLLLLERRLEVLTLDSCLGPIWVGTLTDGDA